MSGDPRRPFVGLLAILLGALLAWTSGEAQLPSTSPAALGTANNYTALARGFGAIAINPANLALPDNPPASLTVGAGRVGLGVGPIDVWSVADYEGRLVPPARKEAWMREIADAGGLTGRGGAGVSLLAFTMGAFGLEIATAVHAQADLSEDAAELILFGNAGRYGVPGVFELEDSFVEGFAATTLAVSYARRLPLELGYPDAFLAAGITAKYTMGHGLVYGRNRGSRLTSEPVEVEVRFPVIAPESEGDELNAGTGFALDVGAVWRRERWTLGAVLQNLVQTFSWDLGHHTFRPGEAFFNEEDSDSDFDERPVAEAPGWLRGEAEARGFDPGIGLGAAYEVSRKLVLTADFRHRFGEGLHVDDATHFGVGAEGRPISMLPLDAGLAVVPGGFQLAGGAGLVFGPVHLTGAVLAQTGDDDLTAGTVVLSFGGR